MENKCKSCGEPCDNKHCHKCNEKIKKEMSWTDSETLTIKHPFLIRATNAVMIFWLFSFICGIIFIFLWSLDILDAYNISGMVAFFILYLLIICPGFLISLIGQIQFEKDLS